MKFLVHLSAGRYTQGVGYISAAFSAKDPHVTVAVDSANGFASAVAAIQAFGTLHAPCHVRVFCHSPRKPNGFDRWNQQKHLFPVVVPDASDPQVCGGCGAHLGSSDVAPEDHDEDCANFEPTNTPCTRCANTTAPLFPNGLCLHCDPRAGVPKPLNIARA